jgi:predicted nucleic acid-binding protein
VIIKAKQLAAQGLGHYDALHVASAIAGGTKLFVITDDRLIKKMATLATIPVMLPGAALALLKNWYEN